MRTPREGQAYQINPALQKLPASVLVVGVVGQRVHFVAPDGHGGDLHVAAFAGLYLPAPEPARNARQVQR